MSTQPEPINYFSLTQLLRQHEVGLTASELDGFLSGLICGGNRDNSWITLMQDFINDGQPLAAALHKVISSRYRSSKSLLASDSFDFQLLLPDEDEVTVFARADALAGWVNHFLLGLGIMQPKLEQLSQNKNNPELHDALNDLRQIGMLGYDAEDDPEELAHSLEEVSEYVRMLTLFCHGEFCLPNTAEPASPPTLH